MTGAAYAAIGSNQAQGAAYVFVKPSSGWTSMTQTAKLTASDGASRDTLGASVSISGNTVVAGAPFASVGANSEQGAACIFVKPANGWANMTETAKLTASDGQELSGFGYSASISGNGSNVVIGAPFLWTDAQGAAYIFVKPASGWVSTSTFKAKLTASDGVDRDNFGQSVSVSGNTAAVGAPYEVPSSQGAVYVFGP